MKSKHLDGSRALGTLTVINLLCYVSDVHSFLSNHEICWLQFLQKSVPTFLHTSTSFLCCYLQIENCHLFLIPTSHVYFSAISSNLNLPRGTLNPSPDQDMGPHRILCSSFPVLVSCHCNLFNNSLISVHLLNCFSKWHQSICKNNP